jgi:hypothetical protein
MYEHYKEHASAAYHLYDPAAFRCGKKVCVWEGLYGPGRRSFLLESIRRYKEFTTTIANLTESYHFYVAPIDCDDRLRQRIEAAIAGCLYQQEGVIGDFQDRNIRYRGRTDQEAAIEVSIESMVKLLGVPPHLLV